MTGQEILDRFYLQVDDDSELSTSEALALANEVYADICLDRAWEWLKTSYAGTQSTTVPYLALPTDFRNLCPNYASNNSLNFGNSGVPINWTPGYFYNSSTANSSVVFVGTNYSPYRIIPFSDRRNYRNASNTCYIDFSTNRLYFTLQPTSAQAVEYDYVKNQANLTLSTEPLFQANFHEIISYGMAMKYSPMQLEDKGQSYMSVNSQLFERGLSQLRLLDANQKLSLA